MTLTDAGIAVIEDDTLLSCWIRQEGRLDVAREHAWLDPLRFLVPVGGTVVDVGASLGALTAIFAEWVGPTGQVFAIEPNRVAFLCLAHNMRDRVAVQPYAVALGAQMGRCGLRAAPEQPKNYGMTYVVPGDDMPVTTLDILSADWPRVDVLKIDAEGSELAILQGARRLIARDQPHLILEVNADALARQGTTPAAVHHLLHELGYGCFPVTGAASRAINRVHEPEIDLWCAPYDKFPEGQEYLRFPAVDVEGVAV